MKNPQNLDTAIQYYQTGNLQQAEDVCRQILNHHQNNSEAWYLLGLIAYKYMQHDSAISYIERAIRENPQNCNYHYALGKLYSIKGMWEEAIEKFRNTLSLKPDYGEAYNYIGIAFAEKGILDEAIEAFNRAIEINPFDAEAANNLGNALLEKGLTDGAIDNYRRAIKLKPEFASAYDNLGNALSEKGMVDEAIESFGKALLLNPDDAGIYFNLACTYMDNDQPDEAIKNYETVLSLNPGFNGIYNNLGLAFAEKGIPDGAIKHYKNALSLNHDDAKAYNNIGFALVDKGMLDEAILNYKKALKIEPDNVEYHKNLGIAYLSAKDLIKGWKEFEWRLKTIKLPEMNEQTWKNSTLKENTLLIHAEQGVGDEIMFASCMPDIISTCSNIILECDSRLTPLFGRSFPSVKLIQRTIENKQNGSEISPVDMKIAIGSLPRFIRPDFSSFPQQKSYLIPDKQKVDVWSTRFRNLGEGLKVGISWRGGRKAKIKHMRSISLEKWSQIFSLKGVHFINLQYGSCTEEIQAIKDKLGVTIHDWEEADPLEDLDGFANQIAALDLVISVDNSTVHMAGALGVPVWTLLSFACDWRWMQGFADTPWYKSVRLYRQSSLGDWDELIERVASDLREFIATGVMPEIDFRHSYKNTG